MKKVLFIGALSFFSMTSAVMAQSAVEEVDMVQSLFGMDKKAAVAEFIHLEGPKADAFWALYDQYEAKRKVLGKERIELLSIYSETYDAMDDAATAEMLKATMDLKASTDKLITEYTKKMKKDVDVKTAAQFYQIEEYILGRIRTKILENIPVLGSM